MPGDTRSTLDPKGLAAVRVGSELRGFLPYLIDIAGELERGIDNRVKMAQNGGKLTPELAHEAWLEKLAIQKVVARVRSRIEFGRTTGEEIADTMLKEDTSG